MSHQPADLQDQTAPELTTPSLSAVPADPPELADLAAMAAHDLVDPLRAVSESLHVLAERHGPELTDDSRDLLAGARADVEQLGQMVESAESTLAYHATHDTLTGLPNRTLFVQKLGEALEHAQNGGGTPAVAHIGIDEFKAVNDAVGRDAGDEVLRALATRLSDALRPGDMLARIGGDEFAALLGTVESRKEALEVVQCLRSALQPPAGTREEHGVTASIGVAVAEGTTGTSPIMRAADAAMRQAKEQGRNRVELFDRAMAERMIRHRSLERALRQAIESDELSLAFQPIVRLADGSVTGLETLVRWQHPEWGTVSPGDFVPIAEQSSLIVDLNEWVMTNALKQLAAWRTAGEAFAANTRLTINLSTRHLARPEIVPFLRNLLASTHIEPRSLDIEITETAFLSRRDAAVDNVNALRSLGVGIALDDFGTGYSSLSHLQELPLDRVKLDGTFTRSLVPTPSSTAIARALTSMAHALCLDVVAESIESREQADLLLAMGCDHGQGYYFAKPCPADEVGAVLCEIERQRSAN
jgi:diguanylate cyclase (GGDEF)-like protein